MSSPLDPQVLGRILLLQSTLQVMPSNEALASFIVAGFMEVPGVADIVVCIEGKCVSAQEGRAAELKPIDCNLFQSHSRLSSDDTCCLTNELEDWERLPIRTTDSRYGTVFIQVSDSLLYQTYSSYLANTVNLIALVVENRRQHNELAASNKGLEEIVKQRTVELENAYQTLKEKENDLKITLNSIGDAVIATDIHGHIKQMNPIAEELTGWSLQEALNRPVEQVFRLCDADSQTERRNLIDEVLKTGKQAIATDHTRLIAKDSTEREIADSASPIVDEAGNTTGVVLVFRDISVQRILEDQLSQARKMESVGQLAGGVAHDFNNMLSAIMGAAEVLSVRTRGNTQLHEFANIILDATEKAASLTQQLLDFSRRGKVTSEPFDSDDTMLKAIQLLRRSIDRRIIIEQCFKAEKHTILGDAAQFQNAILNLGLNARDAMPEGGTLTFSTRNICLSENFCLQSIGDMQPGEYIEIAVSDTGTGISSEDQERIFEPFFTTKKHGKGTGLGLAAVYGMVKEHHGLIRCESSPNEGTTFKFLIPTCSKPISSKETVPEFPHQQGALVLVVDDEVLIRNLAQTILEELGYHVITAANGEEGLSIYKDQKDSIDLVIVDMIMPKMNGRELYWKIKEISPDVRVILCSGYAREQGITDLLASESSVGFIKKPFRRIQFEEQVSKAFELQ